MRNREILGHSVRFVRHVVPATIKPARVLWNEAIGFVFLVLAGSLALSGVATWRAYSGKPSDVVKMVFISIGALLLGYYGVTSFLRARRISRS